MIPGDVDFFIIEIFENVIFDSGKIILIFSDEISLIDGVSFGRVVELLTIK